jgi:hypothetical protein
LVDVRPLSSIATPDTLRSSHVMMHGLTTVVQPDGVPAATRKSPHHTTDSPK